MTQTGADMLERFGTASYQPMTFLDRGVTVPFTTPVLMGARIRPNESRAGLEVVISSLSGGRGFYVVPWPALTDVCTPTVHDRQLWQRLSDQTAISPSLVRDVARAVAVEGLAGREAAAAVALAQKELADARLRTNFMLLLDLIQRTETKADAAVAPHRDSPENIERRARRAVERFAPSIGQGADMIVSWLEVIADAVAGIGLPADPKPSRTRGLTKRLRTLVHDIDAFSRQTQDEADQYSARLLIEAAQLTLNCAKAAFRDLDGDLADTQQLLRAWREDSSHLLRKVTRPDWLLDGWEVILELWREAGPERSHACLAEMALLAPAMPREVKEWLGIEEDWEKPYRMRRLVRVNEDWRSGKIMDLVVRNERVRAQVA